jgi:hypothetical protein
MKSVPAVSLITPLSCNRNSVRPPLVGSFWMASVALFGASFQLFYVFE